MLVVSLKKCSFAMCLSPQILLFAYWPVSMAWFAPVSVSFLVSKHVRDVVSSPGPLPHNPWSSQNMVGSCHHWLSLSLIISLISILRLVKDKTRSSSLLWGCQVRPEMENVKGFLRWFNLINLLFGIGHVRCGLRQIIIGAQKCAAGHLVTPEQGSNLIQHTLWRAV